MDTPIQPPMQLNMSEERLFRQAGFIETKLQKSKQFDKYGLTLVDSNDIIINSLMGELRNIVLSFFKGGLYAEKRCEYCGTTTAKQFDRAHNKGSSRKDVALAALNKIRPDESQTIMQRDFMKAFIEEHKATPLWILCKPCHIKYDKED